MSGSDALLVPLALAAWLLTYLAHSTLLLGGLALLGRLSRSGPEPLTRVAQFGDAEPLWRAAMLGPVVSATVQVLDAPRLVAVTAVRLAAALGAGTTPGTPGGVRVPLAGTRVLDADAWLALPDAFRWTLAGAAAVWGAVAAARVARLLAGQAALRRQLRTRLPLRNPALSARAADLAGGRAIRLTTSDAVASPLAVGRDEVCLPARALAELSPAELDAVLAHEAAHLRRRDGAWLVAVRLAEAALFLQPLNRVAAARLHALAESACDDRAVERTGDPRALAGALARVTTWLLESPSTGSRTTARGAEGVGAIAMASSESLAVARVRRLLDPDRAPLGRGRAVGRAALLLLGVTAGAAPGVAAPAGSVPGAGVTHVLVRAHDPAGPFTLSIERDARGRTVRVLAMTVAGIPVPADRLRHRGDRVLLVAADGATTLEITLAPDGGIRWHPRSPAGSPTSLH